MARILTVLLIAGATMVSCTGSERSVEAFCARLVDEQDRLSAAYEQRAEELSSQDDPFVSLLGGLAMAAGAQGDLVVYFEKLAEVAPDEIRVDVEAVRDALADQAEATRFAGSDPLRAAFGGLWAGLQAQGPLGRVDTFARGNCGRSV